MTLTEATDLTLADQLRSRAVDLRDFADRLDDMAAEMDIAQVPPVLYDLALDNYAETHGEPEMVAVCDLRVRDVIRLASTHGGFTDTKTVAALDAEAVDLSSLPALRNGARCVALRDRAGDLDVGWYPPERMVQLVWRPAPLEDQRPSDLDLFREARHEAETGGL